VGKGEGGLSELSSHLNDSKVFYGLLRVTDQIDNSVTVKFVFIIWVGEKYPFVQKAKVTTHKGAISKLIGQYHNDINVSNASELTEEEIFSKVRDASGSGNRVLSSQPQQQQSQPSSGSHTSAKPTASTTSAPKTTAPKPTSSPTTKNPGVPQTSSAVVFLEEDSIREGIKAVRDNNDPTDWVLLTYEGNSNKVKLAGRGSGGVDEVLSRLNESEIFYGLLRTTDTVDNTVAVKFVLILWVGEKVPFARKARITTNKGEVLGFIGQYHVDVNCSNLSEISPEIIRDLVQRASGTALHVK